MVKYKKSFIIKNMRW